MWNSGYNFNNSGCCNKSHECCGHCQKEEKKEFVCKCEEKKDNCCSNSWGQSNNYGYTNY